MTTKPEGPEQLTDAEVKRLYAAGKFEQIERARLDGRLDELLGIVRHQPPTGDQWTAADLNAMHAAGRFDEINAARTAGQLNTLFGATTTS